MTNREQIQKEILEISLVVANLERTPVYSVPYLYFENLPQIILQKVKNEENMVYDVSTEMPYTVPRNYFENLSNNILQKVQANEFYNELEEVAPLLNTISKAPVYTVPDQYFEKNISHINMPADKPAKVVSIFSTRKFITYAAAAAIIGIMAIGSFLFLNKDGGQINTATVSNTTIADALNDLSEAEIIEYLKNYTPAIDVTNATYNTPGIEGEIEQYIDEMSNEEIQQYLKETTEPGEKKLKEINS